jgi:hypothetical protein
VVFSEALEQLHLCFYLYIFLLSFFFMFHFLLFLSP